MVLRATLFLALTLLMAPAKADLELVSTFGLVWKAPGWTSAVLKPECTQAFVREFGNRGWSSCGGSNPVYFGWPIAVDWTPGEHGVWTIRGGISHLSSVRDDGTPGEYEVGFTGLGAEFTFSWTKWNRKRRR